MIRNFFVKPFLRIECVENAENSKLFLDLLPVVRLYRFQMNTLLTTANKFSFLSTLMEGRQCKFMSKCEENWTML